MLTLLCCFLVLLSFSVLLASAQQQTTDACAQFNGNCNACLTPTTLNVTTNANSTDVKSTTIQYCTYCIDTNACSSLGTATCSPYFQLNYGLNNSCPVPGVLPAYTTSSTGASGVFALLLIIVAPIFIFLDGLRILFHSSQRPVVGRALRDSSSSKTVQVQNSDGVTTTRPADAFTAVALKGLLRVDLDSSHNKFLRPLVFFLIIYIIVGTATALGLNDFQTASVALDTKIAMIGVARPDGDIKAGILGFSNLNFLDGDSRYATNSKYLSGADLRSCMILTVVGGFSLMYAIIVFAAGAVAVAWAFRLYCQASRRGSTYPLTFPARFYTVIAFANSNLGGIMMIWGLPGQLALATGALIPHASFSTGNSWLIILLTKIHVTILEFIVWHLIESAWMPDGVQILPNDNSPKSHSPILSSSSSPLVENNGKEGEHSLSEVIIDDNVHRHENQRFLQDKFLISQTRGF